MLSTKLKEAAGNSADATLYVDDVFSTYLYTGNFSTQTITNGIDLAGKGGLVWMKQRDGNTNHVLIDTVRGTNQYLNSLTTNGQLQTNTALTSFNSSGFTVGADGATNNVNAKMSSWTFRKAAKFFDVVTYTGNGSARTIAHSLGIAPGMVIVKRTDTTGDWQVYSNGLTSAAYSIQLNLINAQASAPTVWTSTAPTSSVFSVGTDATVNASGGTYVAYLFAHDTSATGIIQCGSFTTDVSGNATVNLGYEPQFVLFKRRNSSGGWYINDIMRGASLSGTTATLYANYADAESNPAYGSYPTATGFNTYGGIGTSSDFIYMAIRRPNKPPTSGTQVFSPFVGSDASTITTGFPVDMLFDNKRAGNSNNTVNASRLVGEYSLVTSSTAAETAGLVVANCFQNNTGYLPNALGTGIVSYAFKRAPGFFDEVCYTGVLGATTQAHNLTVAPELMIVKPRSNISLSPSDWQVYVGTLGNTSKLVLNTADAAQLSYLWSSTSPTASVFSISNSAFVNQSGATYVAYLFATLAGISKVGSYTGNGSSQNIECGFAAGARFVLIKRTDSTGDWFVWDTARGIVAANDPHLSLNTTAAEVTTDDSVDPYAAGFAVNQVAATNINVSSATYIFLAIA